MRATRRLYGRCRRDFRHDILSWVRRRQVRKRGRFAHFLFFEGVISRGQPVDHENHLDQVRAIAGRVGRDFGLEIFDVQLRRESIGWVLRVVIDRPPRATGPAASSEGDEVSVTDCQHVSNDVSAVLDAEFSFEHPYTLEVSSPGLDRPLRHPDDCRRFHGRRAQFVTSEAVDGKRHLTGRIADVDETPAASGETRHAGASRSTEIVLEAGRRVHRIPWALVTRARLEVEF